jgi:hypothetical protein
VVAIGDQPAFRVGTSNVEENFDFSGPHPTFYLTRSVLEGGGAPVTFSLAVPPTTGCRPRNTVIEGNIMLASPRTAGFVGSNPGCLTVRGNLFIKAEPEEDPLDRVVRAGNTPGGNLVTNEMLAKDPVQVYGNTLAYLYQPGTGDPDTVPWFSPLNITFDHLLVDGNVVYGPNLAPEQEFLVGYTPDLTPIPGLTPRYKGRVLPNGDQTGYLLMEREFATPPDALSWYNPVVGTTEISTPTDPYLVPLHGVWRDMVLDEGGVTLRDGGFPRDPYLQDVINGDGTITLTAGDRGWTITTTVNGDGTITIAE